VQLYRSFPLTPTLSRSGEREFRATEGMQIQTRSHSALYAKCTGSTLQGGSTLKILTLNFPSLDVTSISPPLTGGVRGGCASSFATMAPLLRRIVRGSDRLYRSFPLTPTLSRSGEREFGTTKGMLA